MSGNQAKQEVAQVGGSNMVQATDPSTVLQVLSRAASDPNTDVEKVERLMQMYERIEAKRAEGEFAAAFAAAQSEMRRVAADATNPQTRSKYATYAALDRVLRPIYTKHGFSLSFDTGEDAPELHVRVLCYVSHGGGHTRTYHANIPADGKGAKGNDVMTKTHATGSAMSYGMRYLLKMIFNVAVGEDDDDGNTAGTGAEPITDKQASTIVDLIADAGADEAKFLEWAGVDDVFSLPTKKYQQAVRLLKAKKGAAK